MVECLLAAYSPARHPVKHPFEQICGVLSVSGFKMLLGYYLDEGFLRNIVQLVNKFNFIVIYLTTHLT